MILSRHWKMCLIMLIHTTVNISYAMQKKIVLWHCCSLRYMSIWYWYISRSLNNSDTYNMFCIQCQNDNKVKNFNNAKNFNIVKYVCYFNFFILKILKILKNLKNFKILKMSRMLRMLRM
jgi:hypothetical protein